MKKLSTLGLMVIFATAPMAYADQEANSNSEAYITCTSCHGGDGTPGNSFQSNVTEMYEFMMRKLNVTKWFKSENKTDGVHNCNNCHLNGV